MAPGVCVASFRVFFRSSDLLRFRLTPTIGRSFPTAETRPDHGGSGRYYSSSSNEPEAPPPVHYDETDEVTVKYIQGLPHITVPLPSRCEKCRFALKPVSHKVFNFVEMLKMEDRGVDRVVVLNEEGIRIASTCSIESLMDEPFWLNINDKQYRVVPPKRGRISSEDLTKLGDVRALVGQLYEALHVGEYHVNREEELELRLEELKYQLSPMEEKQAEMSVEANRRTNFLTWAGLGFMSVQFGILARLTWWEYSWDIMEPVTYFVTYGTAMAGYAYYCTTKTEYLYPDVKDRQYLLSVHKNAKKKKFDIELYNSLKRQVADIEYDLKRLRDPLNMQFAPNVAKGLNRKAPTYTMYTEPSGGGGKGGKGGPGGGAASSTSAAGLILATKAREAVNTLKDLLMFYERKKKKDSEQ